MFPVRRHHRNTYADYVALERESPTKHEFLDGESSAMAGGSEEHSALAAEILRLLGNSLGERKVEQWRCWRTKVKVQNDLC